MNKKALLEGLLFVSGDEGIKIEDVEKVLEINNQELKTIIEEFKQDLKNEYRGLNLEQFGETLKFTTKKEHNEIYEKLTNLEINSPLTNSALEVMAIIAYNQPVTRGEIDDIRGVNSQHHVRKLYLKGLIEELGRSDLPGRPKIYGTTDRFLDCFGIKNLEELPLLEQSETIEEEKDLFKSKYREIGDNIESEINC